MRFRCAVLAFVAIGVMFAVFPAHAGECESQIPPSQMKKMLEDREVFSTARLDQNYYGFNAAMVVHAPLEVVYKILTDYAVYKELVPYIDRADFDPRTKRLILEGGIWKFRLSSLVEFTEFPGGLVRYHILGGHFAGLTGEMRFEGKGEKGVLVCFKGGVSGNEWPPRFVIERGAEIVFGFTAKRMRSYVESPRNMENDREKGASPHDSNTKDAKSKNIPRPRKRID